MQKHNQREFENHSNKDIDKEKEHLNYDLVNPENIDYRDKIMNTINEQRESTRKIRKDAVLVNEFIVTSDKKFFEDLSADEQKKFFESAKDWFQERYGEKNVTFAMVHNDESTPHMHLGVVPMKDGKLQSKNVFNRAELLHIQDQLPVFLEKKGFDIQRGKEGSDNVHADFNDWKKEQAKIRQEVLELRREAESLREEVEIKRSEKISLETEVSTLKTEKIELESENQRYRASFELIDDEPFRYSERKLKKKNGEIEVDKENVIVPRAEIEKINELKRYSSVMTKDLKQANRRAINWESKATLLATANEELKGTLKTAKNRMDKMIKGGGELWNRCISYAHQFHRKDKSSHST